VIVTVTVLLGSCVTLVHLLATLFHVCAVLFAAVNWG
jgi:hypothetical protein